MMKRRVGAFLLVVVLVTSACGCVGDADAEQALALVESLCGSVTNLPSGEYYTFGMAEGIPMSEDLLVGMLGEGRMPSELDEAQTGACYLAHASPFEVTVFCAKSRHGAQNLARMLIKRRDALLRFWTGRGIAREDASGVVTLSGRWVILAVGKDAEELSARFCRAA